MSRLPNGLAGEWLLDPVDITISTASTNNIIPSSDPSTNDLFLNPIVPIQCEMLARSKLRWMNVAVC